MCHSLLYDPKFLALLLRIDHELAAQTRADGCVCGGSLHRALVGDMLAADGVKNGWAGVVVFGAVRDAAVLATLDLGVKALGTNPMRSVKRGDGDLDVPVAFGGVIFTPGDTLFADQDGVAVLAADA